MKKRRILSLLLALAMLSTTLLTGCGGGGGSADAENTYTWWIYSGADSMYYNEYQENPAVQYTLQKGWGPEEKKIALEFWQPAAGKELDNYTINSDEDWGAWCKSLQKYNYQKAIDIYQPYVDAYPFY